MRDFILNGSWRKLVGFVLTQACILGTGFAAHASPEIIVGGLVATFATFAGAQAHADRGKGNPLGALKLAPADPQEGEP